jgi:membrane-bound lytic murein transglycosylase B
MLPRDFSASEANIKESRSASYWRKRGLRYLSTADVNASGEIPDDSTPLYAMLAGDESGDAYLLTKNFHVLLNWNRSRYFATAVGTLADAMGEPL